MKPMIPNAPPFTFTAANKINHHNVCYNYSVKSELTKIIRKATIMEHNLYRASQGSYERALFTDVIFAQWTSQKIYPRFSTQHWSKMT